MTAPGDPRVDVSVVIATHNRSDMLRTCLRGVLAQEDVELEVIVVDDGSTDGTAAMVADLGDPRLRVIRHEQPHGVAVSRNAGIASASGSWIAFTDDDDLWAPSKLREQVLLGEATGAVMVYCGAVVFRDDSEAVSPDRPVPSPTLARNMLLRGNPLPGGASTQLARREVLLAVGGFDTQLHHLADWDLWIRLSAAGSLAAVAEPLVAYRRHVTNMVLTHAQAHLDELEWIVAKHGKAARAAGIEIDRVGFNYWVASGQRRAGRRLAAARIHLAAAMRYRDAGHFGTALRSPLGSWAVGLRSKSAPCEIPPPAWLHELRTGQHTLR